MTVVNTTKVRKFVKDLIVESVMQVYLATMSINALAVVNSGMDSISVVRRRLMAVESSCKHRLMTNHRPQHPMLPFLAKKLVSILFVCYS